MIRVPRKLTNALNFIALIGLGVGFLLKCTSPATDQTAVAAILPSLIALVFLNV